MMRKMLVALFFTFIFISLAVSCSPSGPNVSEEDILVDESRDGAERIETTYYPRIETLEVIEDVKDKIDDKNGFQIVFCGYSSNQNSQVIVHYCDSRSDVDAENAIKVQFDEKLISTDTFEIWDEKTKEWKLSEDIPSRDGYRLVGWEVDFTDKVNIKNTLFKYVKKLLYDGMTEDEKNKCVYLSCEDISDSLAETYLSNKGVLLPSGMTWNDLNKVVLASGENFMPYFKDLFCAFYAYEYNFYAEDENEKVVPACPYEFELRAVWEPSGTGVALNYCDYEYSGNGVVAVKIDGMPHRIMYSGTPYFGHLSKMIPEKSGYKFIGWKDSKTGKEFNYVSDINTGDTDKISAVVRYFNDNYANEKTGQICDLIAMWIESEFKFYVPASVMFIPGNSDFDASFLTIPKGLLSYKSASYGDDLNDLSTIRVANSYSIAAQDVSGKQLVALLNRSKSEKWGFEELPCKIVFSVDMEKDYWTGDDENLNSEIVVSGVEWDGDFYSIKNMTSAKSGSDYPISFVNLPQAIVICNLFTAAYNSCHSVKLTYAYAGGLTSDLSDGGVVKRTASAIEYIKGSDKAGNYNLSLPGSTGFRLPKDYEYQVASTIVPSAPKSYVGKFLDVCKDLLCVHDGEYPVFVKNFFPTVLGVKSYYGETSMSEVSDSAYTNPLGMIHATGNVRKWLDTKLSSTGDRIEINGEASNTLNVPVVLSSKFDQERYEAEKKKIASGDITRDEWLGSNYNPSNWFTKLADRKIGVRLTGVSQDESVLYFEFSFNEKGAKVEEIESSFSIPKSLVKFSDAYKMPNVVLVRFNSNDKSIKEIILTRKEYDEKAQEYVEKEYKQESKTKIDVEVDLPSNFMKSSFNANCSKYDPTDWFTNLKDLGVRIELITKLPLSGNKMKFSLDFDGVKKKDKNGVASDFVIPLDLLDDSSKLIVKIVSSDSHYMIRSGSFMLNEAESIERKFFDASPDARRSAAPYNCAYYDLGMRVVRSL